MTADRESAGRHLSLLKQCELETPGKGANSISCSISAPSCLRGSSADLCPEIKSDAAICELLHSFVCFCDQLAADTAAVRLAAGCSSQGPRKQTGRCGCQASGGSDILDQELEQLINLIKPAHFIHKDS